MNIFYSPVNARKERCCLHGCLATILKHHKWLIASTILTINLASTFHFLPAFCSVFRHKECLFSPAGPMQFCCGGLIHFTSPAVRAPHTGPHCTPIYETWAIFTTKATCTVQVQRSAAFTATLLLVALAFLIADSLHTQSTRLSISWRLSHKSQHYYSKLLEF